MHTWHRDINSLASTEIALAVRNDAWQRFRLSLKGLSTEDKLEHLNGYLARREQDNKCKRVHYVRVDNYLNALLRGGQLKRTTSGRVIVQR